MSKKVSEFERYERMKKLEKEAEVEKRKSEVSAKKKVVHMKQVSGMYSKNDYRNYTEYEDEEF